MPLTSTLHWPGTGSVSLQINTCGVSVTEDVVRSPELASAPEGSLKRKEPLGLSLKNNSVASLVPGAMPNWYVNTSPDANSPVPTSARDPLAWSRKVFSVRRASPAGPDSSNDSPPERSET